MTKKDYIKFAELLKTHIKDCKENNHNKEHLELITWIAYDMAELFKADNANFDKKRFFDYINK